MKKLLLPITSFILLVTACKKQPENISATISYQLSDDVSPLIVKFDLDTKVNEDSKWIIGDSMVYENALPDDDFVLKFKFDDQGTYYVKVTATEVGTENNVTGNTEINIPDIANRIKITGIDFRHHNLNITDTQILIETNFYDGTAYQQQQKLVNTPTGGSSIILNTPIIYDITGIKNADPNNFFMNLTIKGSSTGTEYYNGVFWLKNSYFGERIYGTDDNLFDKGSVVDNNNRTIYLNLDWYIH